MTTALVHFLIGTFGSLAISLWAEWISGVQRFSAPFGVVFIGITCASLAVYLSPWSTAAVLVLYAAVARQEAAP